MKQIYPITTVENVIDLDTNKNIKETLDLFNHINLGNQPTIDAARIAVPNNLRKTGLYVTYRVAETIYTDIFIGNEYNLNNDLFVKEYNWYNVQAINLSTDTNSLTPVFVDTKAIESNSNTIT